jgi:cytochrome c-type biogenesis protein CcmE
MGRRTKSKNWIIGLAIIGIAIIGISFLNLGDNMVYFLTPEEALAAKGGDAARKDVKVGGLVLPGQVQKNAETGLLAFTLSDLKGHEFSVHYRGTPPDLFKEGQGVVVEGKFDENGVFVARQLMVKHSEEYKKPGDPTHMNRELLEKSLFKEKT